MLFVVVASFAYRYFFVPFAPYLAAVGGASLCLFGLPTYCAVLIILVNLFVALFLGFTRFYSVYFIFAVYLFIYLACLHSACLFAF